MPLFYQCRQAVDVWGGRLEIGMSDSRSGASVLSIVWSREVVRYSEVPYIYGKINRGHGICPLYGGCPLFGESVIRGFTVVLYVLTSWLRYINDKEYISITVEPLSSGHHWDQGVWPLWRGGRNSAVIQATPTQQIVRKQQGVDHSLDKN